MTMTISGTDGLTFPDSTAQYSGSYFSFKNRIINGDMRIDQRNAGAAVTTSGAYPTDRWKVTNTTDGAYSAQRSTTAPAGYTNSLYLTVTTADATLTTTQQLFITQSIEGNNVADLGFGTASAKTVTLSFQVRSSLTGTFAGVLRNSAGDRSYVFTYVINAADTWETKTITVAGDTTGTWLTDNGIGLDVVFSLGAGPSRQTTSGSWTAGGPFTGTSGQVAPISTLNSTWYITGVQLEVGSVATPFERRPYGTELMLCQRYYYKAKATSLNSEFGTGWVDSTTAASILVPFPVSMRIAPTAVEQSGTASNYQVIYGGFAAAACSSVPAFAAGDFWGSRIQATVASGLTVGQGCGLRNNSTSAYLAWSAEL